MTRDRFVALAALAAVSAVPIPSSSEQLLARLPSLRAPVIAMRSKSPVQLDRALRSTTPPNPKTTRPEPPRHTPPEPPRTAPPSTTPPEPPRIPSPDGLPGTLPPIDMSPLPILPPPSRKRANTEPPKRPRKSLATKALAHGLVVRDNFLGLAVLGSGDIARALKQSVRHHVPTVGRASFTAHIASDGELLNIRLASFSGKRYRWRNAANAAMTSLRGRVFPLRELYGSGARIHIDLITNLELPSGSGRTHKIDYKKRWSKPRWPWGPDHKANEAATRESLNSYGDDIPADPVELLAANGELDQCPKVELGPNAELALHPDGGVGVTIVFDLSDIGAHPIRVVHTRLRVEPANHEDIGPRKDAQQDHLDGADQGVDSATSPAAKPSGHHKVTW